MMRVLTVFGAGLLLMLMPGCGPASPEQSSTQAVSETAPEFCRPGAPLYPTASPDFVLSEMVPGYAGLYFNEEQLLVVMLTDPRQQVCAERVIRQHLTQLFRQVPGGASSPILFREAQFDLLDLNRWRFRVLPQMNPSPYLMMGISVQDNRIEMGVENEAAEEVARSLITETDVPLKAVQFIFISEIILDALYDSERPSAFAGVARK